MKSRCCKTLPSRSRARETICVLGRSGTGKSVTLKLIIALMKPEAGHIWIDGEDITQLEGQELSRVRRKMGFLFQNAALFDFLTLYDNLALPLRRLTHKSKQEIEEIIDRVLHQVGLSGDQGKDAPGAFRRYEEASRVSREL